MQKDSTNIFITQSSSAQLQRRTHLQHNFSGQNNIDANTEDTFHGHPESTTFFQQQRDSTNIFITPSSDVISTVGNTSITDHLAGTNQRNNRRRTQQPSGGQAADKWQASRDQHNCVVLCFFSGPPQSGSPRCRRVGACVLL
ncbi:PREDICTED: uncharacterized protein LOC106814937 isoform X3 [Priapulus caudatus]|uniref:Uncharacterized protein LOC106814937 isoform X3 n=1 Tax=Priapulus caudatus TaxID=37621 RepID=A0ABM1ERJ1_PRICU|nr:PREDICTED: uncharacterized protein LOC106814937 isoform X3 [Priapulus caudatus]